MFRSTRNASTVKVLFISHTSAGGPFVVGSHHLARSLADQGHEVVHLGPPVTPAHMSLLGGAFDRKRFARCLAGGERLNDVVDVIPFSPLPWGLACRMATVPHLAYGRFVLPSVRRQLAAHGMLKPDLVLIDEPRLASLLPAFPGARVVYRATDLYTGTRGGPWVREAEMFTVAQAHRFIATSEPVADHLRDLGARHIEVIENGVDLNHFNPVLCAAPMERQRVRPALIYTGALDRRFGFDSVLAAAESNPDLDFRLIGPTTHHARSALDGKANIELMGAVPYSELPSYLAEASAALLPLSSDQANEGRSPMKLYEYGAMGLPVFATHTVELARRAMSFVALARSADDFALNIARWKRGLLRLQDGCSEAQHQGWPVKAQAVLHAALG